ncbi:MAG: GNAT family N-acetyltransferase [Demequinaceae bacterium]|nr:GNAT family N-acetyltransferase [Demequinaceae bacterium]
MSEEDDLRIDRVGVEDVGELLTLRRAAFVTEAQLYDDPHLPALTQTLEELQADLESADIITLGAWRGHRMVGTIRVGIEGDKANLGRLAVAPDVQGHGIGTKLLFANLEHLPETIKEVWVFTGQNSKHNISVYNEAGYEHQFDKVFGDLTYAYLRKVLEAGNIVDDDESASRGEN